MRQSSGPGDASSREESAQLEEDAVSRLLDIAGHRPSAPEWVRQKGKVAARRAWEAKVEQQAERRRSQRRYGAWFALAAAGILAVVAGRWWIQVQPVELGQVAALSGDVLVLSGPSDSTGAEPIPSRRETSLAMGQQVNRGDEIRTAEGYVSLLFGGASLRLDRNSRLTLEDEGLVRLEAGALYFDSAARPATSAFQVSTSFGIIEDIGTQFEVRVEGQKLRIQVREGEIELETATENHRAAQGTALVMRPDSDGVERQTVAIHGETWQWVLAAAPELELEGQMVGTVLEWVSRETGWILHFEDAALEAEVASIVTLGAPAGLRPDEAPAVVLPISALDYRVEDGVLYVSRAIAP